jgi:hypothetical protein
MRPVRRGASPLANDFAEYRDAFPYLVGHLGDYCSYCEREIRTQLAVEHVQPKALAQYAHLVGRWENFLLGCVNCNSTKLDKDVDPRTVLLPDRDNTFAAIEYTADGKVRPAPASPADIQAMAARLLTLVGLDKKPVDARDENDKLIALDRVTQRMEAWGEVRRAKELVDQQPGNVALREMAVRFARARGFFSVWMAVFEGDADMRNRLIDAFPGTRASGCFDPATTEAHTPAPNPDGLPHGGKT